jgi:hypothetical protein
MKHKIFGHAAGAMLAVAMVLIIGGPAFSQTAKGATLTSVKGTVTVLAPGQAAAKAAAENMAVPEGSVIKTSSKSSVMIKFSDGSLVKIGPLSSLTISKAAGASGKNTKLDIAGGKVYARVKKKDSSSDFTIKTPTAIAGVRGTYYSSEVDEDASSKFDVFEGEVAVSSIDNPTAEILVKANQTTSVKQGQAPAAPTAIPKERAGEAAEGISDGEVMAASLDLAISVEPEKIVVGGKAVVSIKVMQNGEQLNQEVPLHLKVNSAAVFSNGKSEIDVTTGKDGAATVEISGVSEESVSIEASVILKVKKKKKG